MKSMVWEKVEPVPKLRVEKLHLSGGKGNRFKEKKAI
jgi:hypothetical protein